MIHDCLRKQEKSEINNLKPEAVGEKRTAHKVSRRKEIIKIRAEIKTKKTIEKISEMKSWFFGKKNS